MALDVKYHNSTIATLSEDGTIVATTAGNYCDDDLTVECADAIFTPMPPDDSYQNTWDVPADTTYIPRPRMSAIFTGMPVIRFRITNIPSNLDKTKYSFTANIIGDATQEDFVKDVTIVSDTEVRCEYGANYASQFTDKMLLTIYYDNNVVGAIRLCYGGYIRQAWSIADAANMKFFRAFWAYGLQAKVVFG